MRCLMRCLLCLTSLTSAIPMTAFAEAEATQPSFAGPFVDHAPLSDIDLDSQRGGFIVNGVSVSLGSQLNTYLDGQLVLATTLNWTASGATSSTVVSAALTPADQTMLHSAIVSGGTLAVTPANAQVYVVNGGQTALYQSVTNGLQNVLINAAPSLRASQTINATIGLTGYAGFNSSNLISMLGQALGNAVGLAGIH